MTLPHREAIFVNFVHVDKALRKLNRYNVSAEDMERIRADSPPRERQRRTGDRAGVIVFNVPSMEVLFVAQTFTRRGLEKTVFTYPSGKLVYDPETWCSERIHVRAIRELLQEAGFPIALLRELRFVGRVKVDGDTIMLLAGRDLRDMQERDDWLRTGTFRREEERRDIRSISWSPLDRPPHPLHDAMPRIIQYIRTTSAFMRLNETCVRLRDGTYEDSDLDDDDDLGDPQAHPADTQPPAVIPDAPPMVVQEIYLGDLPAKAIALYARAKSLRPSPSADAVQGDRNRVEVVAKRLGRVFATADRRLKQVDSNFAQTFMTLADRIKRVRQSLEEKTQMIKAQEQLFEHVTTTLTQARRVNPPDGLTFRWWDNAPSYAEMIEHKTIYQYAAALREEFPRLVHMINELLLPHGSPPVPFHACTHFGRSAWLDQGCVIMWLESINNMGPNVEDQMYEYRGRVYQQKVFDYSVPHNIYHAWTRVRVAYKNALIHSELQRMSHEANDRALQPAELLRLTPSDDEYGGLPLPGESQPQFIDGPAQRWIPAGFLRAFHKRVYEHLLYVKRVNDEAQAEGRPLISAICLLFTDEDQDAYERITFANMESIFPMVVIPLPTLSIPYGASSSQHTKDPWRKSKHGLDAEDKIKVTNDRIRALRWAWEIGILMHDLRQQVETVDITRIFLAGYSIGAESASLAMLGGSWVDSMHRLTEAAMPRVSLQLVASAGLIPTLALFTDSVPIDKDTKALDTAVRAACEGSSWTACTIGAAIAQLALPGESTLEMWLTDSLIVLGGNDIHTKYFTHPEHFHEDPQFGTRVRDEFNRRTHTLS